MDVRCPKCGEPWDLDSIHERAAELNDEVRPPEPEHTYAAVAADFRKRGCEALGESCPIYPDTTRDPDTGCTPAEAAEAATFVYEMLGDDMDGAAAMLEDLGF